MTVTSRLDMNASLAGPTPATKAAARTSYERDGFFLAPAILPAELIQRLTVAMDAVMRGEFETGVAPVGYNGFAYGQKPASLVKIDNAHRSNRTILEAVTHPLLGEWAAAVTGAARIQVFCTQLLVKPPGTSESVNVGWHQDMEYWCSSMQGGLFTAWLAVSDVPLEAGPMRFVRGSHRWGLLQAGDFFSGNLDATRKRMQEKHGQAAWDEVPGVLPAGAVSFHNNLTIHGSGANLGTTERRSFAVHLMTETGGMLPGRAPREFAHLNDFSDQSACPVIYRADGG